MCYPADVLFWIRVYMNGAPVFINGITDPDEDQSYKAIKLAQATIVGRFRSAGFRIPIVPIAGEEWPEDQNEYLRFVCGMAAAVYLTQGSIAPAPHYFGSRDNEESSEPSLGRMVKQELDLIFDRRQHITKQHALRFRASYDPNTAASYALELARGPEAHITNRYKACSEIVYGNYHDMSSVASALDQLYSDESCAALYCEVAT